MKVILSLSLTATGRCNPVPCIKAMREAVGYDLRDSKNIVDRMRDAPDNAIEVFMDPVEAFDLLYMRGRTDLFSVANARPCVDVPLDLTAAVLPPYDRLATP